MRHASVLLLLIVAGCVQPAGDPEGDDGLKTGSGGDTAQDVPGHVEDLDCTDLVRSPSTAGFHLNFYTGGRNETNDTLGDGPYLRYNGSTLGRIVIEFLRDGTHNGSVNVTSGSLQLSFHAAESGAPVAAELTGEGRLPTTTDGVNWTFHPGDEYSGFSLVVQLPWEAATEAIRMTWRMKDAPGDAPAGTLLALAKLLARFEYPQC